MANWLSEEPRSLLRAMSMTVCDLSAITKPWPIEKRVADLVTSEFFEQGDMERQELNITPIVSPPQSALIRFLVSHNNFRSNDSHTHVHFHFHPFAGHNEQGKRERVTNDASEFHRYHLSTDLRGNAL